LNHLKRILIWLFFLKLRYPTYPEETASTN
jgi:hypothetical protein